MNDYNQILVLRDNAKHKDKILNRDRECVVCGCSSYIILELHHIIPLKCGGTNTADNFVILCPNCHAAAHKLAENVTVEKIGHYVAVLHSTYTTEQILKLKSLVR